MILSKVCKIFTTAKMHIANNFVTLEKKFLTYQTRLNQV